MKKIINEKYALTHAGCFHLDDVLCSVFVKKLNNKIIIKRVFAVTQKELSNKNIIVYDIGLDKFDHHQADRKIDDFGYPYSAFGLLWEEYGKKFLREIGFTKVDEAFNKFKLDIVQNVDRGDNDGYQCIPYFKEGPMIKSFNPTWIESRDDNDAFNKSFYKAMDVVNCIFDNWMKRLFEEIEMKELELQIWNDALKTINHGMIILKENIPWRTIWRNNPVENLRYVIASNERGGYIISSVDKNKYKVVKNKYFDFVHPSGFMGTAKNLEDAMLGVENLC